MQCISEWGVMQIWIWLVRFMRYIFSPNYDLQANCDPSEPSMTPSMFIILPFPACNLACRIVLSVERFGRPCTTIGGGGWAGRQWGRQELTWCYNILIVILWADSVKSRERNWCRYVRKKEQSKFPCFTNFSPIMTFHSGTTQSKYYIEGDKILPKLMQWVGIHSWQL